MDSSLSHHCSPQSCHLDRSAAEWRDLPFEVASMHPRANTQVSPLRLRCAKTPVERTEFWQGNEKRAEQSSRQSLRKQHAALQAR